MHVQVRTSDGRIYDADVNQSATCGDLLAALFHPNPVPRNSSIMARTRIIDLRELVANVMQHELFLVGPKPDVVAQQQHRQPHEYNHHHHHHQHQQQQQQHHNGHRSQSNHSQYDHQQRRAADPAVEAVNHLRDFVASPPTATSGQQQNQPQFQPMNSQQAADNRQRYEAERLRQQEAQARQQSFQQQQQQQQQQNHRNGHSQHQSPPPPPHYQFNSPQATSPTTQQPPQQQQQQPPQQQAPAKKPTTPSEIIADVRKQYLELVEKAKNPSITQKDKLVMNEVSMRLMFRLDGLDDLSPELKADRREVVRAIQAFQDRNDGKESS